MAKGKIATEETVATYTKSELIESAAELGTTPEILAGALVSVKKERITIDEAQAAVTAYCSRVVGN